MNIFALSQDPITAAQLQCDKHVVKMILETAQMLSTAHRELGSNISSNLLYKKTHVNHPSAMWIRETSDNYTWAVRHFEALCDEYTFRYGKTHLSDTKLRKAFCENMPLAISSGKLSSPPQCMPPQYHVRKSHVFDWAASIAAYTQYYGAEKSAIARYTKRPTPTFIEAQV